MNEYLTKAVTKLNKNTYLGEKLNKIIRHKFMLVYSVSRLIDLPNKPSLLN